VSEYGFTKLFSSITKSTVWCEPHTTFRVWIAMLADCDRHGRVMGSIPGLANLSRVTVQECEAAINTFLAPDPYSRTPEHEGRRIEPIPGGWRLLNYDLYREKRDPEARREQNREAKQRQREREKGSADVSNDDDGDVQKDDKSEESAQGRRQKAELEDQEHPAQPAASRFTDFWQVYPRKRGKQPAAAKWKSKRLDARADEIIADVRKRITSDDRWKRGFIPDPATYLGQERWEDALGDDPPAPSQPTTPSPKGPTETPLEHALAYARQRRDRGELDPDAYVAECARITAKHRGEARA